MDSHRHQQHGQTHAAREHMFEKHLTPSDVGKLNRLVIPKQHAERHFPLDSGSGEKGLLLSFEDETGKAWMFRYSYWTSSQSYVLTKGWSRFVKEKKLDVGDAVLFERYRSGPGGGDDRLYICCRRRRASDAGDNIAAPAAACRANAVAPCFYMINSINGGGAAAETPTGNTRRLRLFGVNLECGTEQPEPENFAPPSWSQFMPTNASTPQL